MWTRWKLGKKTTDVNKESATSKQIIFQENNEDLDNFILKNIYCEKLRW